MLADMLAHGTDTLRLIACDALALACAEAAAAAEALAWAAAKAAAAAVALAWA